MVCRVLHVAPLSCDTKSSDRIFPPEKVSPNAATVAPSSRSPKKPSGVPSRVIDHESPLFPERKISGVPGILYTDSNKASFVVADWKICPLETRNLGSCRGHNV